jgi:hypothetical protein
MLIIKENIYQKTDTDTQQIQARSKHSFITYRNIKQLRGSILHPGNHQASIQTMSKSNQIQTLQLKICAKLQSFATRK